MDRLRKGEKKIQNELTKFLNLEMWELVLHVLFVVLVLYIAYITLMNKGADLNTTNLLLLLVACGVAVQIHQNINLVNRLD